jgi:hypothetical protein
MLARAAGTPPPDPMEERRPAPRSPVPSPGKVTAIILALALVGLGRMAWFHLAVERRIPHPPPIDDRYRAARALLPVSGTIGYVSDARVARTPAEYETSKGTRRYIEAQYSLAPLILKVEDSRAALVLADAADPAALPALLEQRNLRAVADTGRGVAVARPGTP